MPPKTRSDLLIPGAGRGHGGVLPTTPEELAQLISQHVNAALQNQGAGRGRGRGVPPSGNLDIVS